MGWGFLQWGLLCRVEWAPCWLGMGGRAKAGSGTLASQKVTSSQPWLRAKASWPLRLPLCHKAPEGPLCTCPGLGPLSGWKAERWGSLRTAILGSNNLPKVQRFLSKMFFAQSH